MDEALGVDLEPEVFYFVDDIIIATSDFERHLWCLERVAERLKTAGLTISLEKSKFCRKEIEFLGFVIAEDGIKTNTEKVKAILEYRAPKNVTEIRRFLGMAGWYRHYIPSFAEISAPISNLTRKGTKFLWSEECQIAFEKLKQCLTTAPVLASPNFDKPFSILVDSSQVGVGAVLVQGEGTEQRVISYMSQKLNKAQQRYSVTELEFLGALLAIYKFRPYVEGARFTVVTDHASLLWLRNLKDPVGRLARWAMKLQQFDFSFVHRKGREHVVPDALSRSVEEVRWCPHLVHSDQSYENLRKRVESVPEEYEEYKVVGDRIYKLCTNPSLKQPSWKLMLPKTLRMEALFQNHDVPTAGHLGGFKTLRRLQEKYYWPGMRREALEYVSRCETCKAVKDPSQAMTPPMGNFVPPKFPWQRVSVDLMGPFPRSKKGNQYILSIMDVFSKYLMLQPLRNANASAVIRYMEEQVFLQFGVPEVILSDNGSQFSSKQFAELLSRYNITHWKTAFYTPQANPVERSNKVVLAAMRAYISDDHKEWDMWLPHIACAIRTSVHESTKFSPYYVNFGRNMVTDGKEFDRILLTPSQDGEIPLDCKLQEVWKKAREALYEARKKYEQYYNKSTKGKEFEVGDAVWKRNFVQSSAPKNVSAKLVPKFVKCWIKAKCGENTYMLSDKDGKEVGKYHAKDLLPASNKSIR